MSGECAAIEARCCGGTSREIGAFCLSSVSEPAHARFVFLECQQDSRGIWDCGCNIPGHFERLVVEYNRVLAGCVQRLAVLGKRVKSKVERSSDHSAYSARHIQLGKKLFRLIKIIVSQCMQTDHLFCTLDQSSGICNVSR